MDNENRLQNYMGIERLWFRGIKKDRNAMKAIEALNERIGREKTDYQRKRLKPW